MPTAHVSDKTATTPLGQILQIQAWFGAMDPAPSRHRTHTQIGEHLEEVSEMLRVLRNAGSTFSAREQLGFAADVLSYTQRQLKSGNIEIALDDVDRLALLDVLCDQIVTAVGIAHMLDMDISRALKEVADSNDSKFGEDGRPIFNDQRKMMEGPRHRRPDLFPFIQRLDKDA